VTMPLQGKFVVCRLELPIINLHTKLNSPCSTATNIRKAMQNVETEVV